MENMEGEAWRNIDRSTKAGRLLGQIYGGHTKVQISYPKLKKKKNAGAQRPAYRGGGGTNTTSRQARRDNHVRVPRPVPSNHAAVNVKFPLPSRPSRKPRAEIEAEMKVQRTKRLAERPVPLRKGISTAAEKQRLQNSFQFGGGKALPSTLLPGGGKKQSSVGTVRELTDEGKTARAVAAQTRRRTERAEQKAAASADADAVLFNELVHEIEERGAFLAEMREIGGLDAAQERAVTQQIQSRVSRLGKLKQKLERQS